jgi:hypothetical protein
MIIIPMTYTHKSTKVLRGVKGKTHKFVLKRISNTLESMKGGTKVMPPIFLLGKSKIK